MALDGLNRFWKTLQTIDASDEDVCTPRFFNSETTCNQSMAPSVWAIHRPSAPFLPARLMPMAR
jgi:hypothetical protein